MQVDSTSLADLQPLPSGSVSLADHNALRYLSLRGWSNVDAAREGRWSNGPSASIVFNLLDQLDHDILLKFDLKPFVWKNAVPEQIVDVDINGAPSARWRLADRNFRRHVLVVERASGHQSGVLTVEFSVPTCAAPADLGVNPDPRRLGILLTHIGWERLEAKPDANALVWQYGRLVVGEARKSFDQKIESGFWSRFITGPKVLDIGFKGGLVCCR
jgi:hypothetical protein